MAGRNTNTGANLKRQWRIPARQVRYREDGRWFMPLEEFPGALADKNGYIVFPTQQEYRSSGELRIGSRINVTGGISRIPGYVRFGQRPASHFGNGSAASSGAPSQRP